MNLDTTHFKKLLQEEKAKLEQELSLLGIKNESGISWDPVTKEDEDPADREDVASTIEQHEDKERIVSVLETQLHEVDHALGKIDSGTYGICEVSGNEIEQDRLEANPSARTCKAHMN